MITNFKIFESVSVAPKVGDYVIVIEPMRLSKDETYKQDTIGKIVDIKRQATFPYIIILDSGDTEVFQMNEFKYWSDNKEELEQILVNNKFNI